MAAPQGQPATDAGSSVLNPPTTKQIHSLILDTGPLIKNDPPASVLLAKAEKLYTLPVIVSEIRDAATRSRVETTLLPFVTLRSPRPESVRFVANFAKKTGDYSVLSRPDLEVLALGYELECERNEGDWRLRSTPGQTTLNGKPPSPPSPQAPSDVEHQGNGDDGAAQIQGEPEVLESDLEGPMQKLDLEEQAAPTVEEEATEEEVVATDQPNDDPDPDADSASDSEGWITPSNLKRQQAKDSSGSTDAKQPAQRTLQAAILTSDYAMQNVALRINLNLVTPSLARITHLKSWVLRCHGCFTVCRDMTRHFCPKCGQPTLTRVSCSTDDRGRFQVHLKTNFQWNNRGNVYSVPKPVHGSSNGRLPKNVGGKNGWGRDLILAEDQKEHLRSQDELRRQRNKDLMDDDFLPGLLGGDRHSGGGGKIRIGAGRNINSRRKR